MSRIKAGLANENSGRTTVQAWLLLRNLILSYYIGETMLTTIYTHNGNLVSTSLTSPSRLEGFGDIVHGKYLAPAALQPRNYCAMGVLGGTRIPSSTVVTLLIRWILKILHDPKNLIPWE